MTIKFTYFNFEGRGEAIRLALVLSKTKFEDVRVDFPDWPALKPTLPGGLLPVLQIDNGPILTQSTAILRLVGKKYSDTLYPAKDEYAIDEAMGIVDDMVHGWEPCEFFGLIYTKLGHPEDLLGRDEGKEIIEKMRTNWIKNELPGFAKRITEMLEKNGGWFATKEGPSIADCKLVPFLRTFTCGHIEHVAPDTLEAYPALIEYVKRFCALDLIKGRYTTGLY
jgi:prostaglandin-H2 D-isomerase / glutathione transferase